MTDSIPGKGEEQMENKIKMAIIRLSGKAFVSPLDFPRKCSNACKEGSSFESIAQDFTVDSSSNGTPPDNQSTADRCDATGKARQWSQILALLPVYLLQICYGMNTGYPAIMTPQLREDCSEFEITEDQESWIVSIDNVATPLVCILSGFLQQKFGPLKVLLFACFPYSIGWLFAAMATSVNYIYVSRLLVGVSHALLTTTVYTVEVASRDMRGTYSLLESVLRCVGCLLIYSLGFAFRWKAIAIFAPAVPLMALISGLMAPESPVYLLSRRKPQEARKALSRLYGSQYRIEEEMTIIQDNLKQIKLGRKHKSTYIKDLKSHPEVYKPFLIIMVLSTVQQFSGMSILRAYVVKIFDEVFTENRSHNASLASLNCTLDMSASAVSSISTEAYVSAIILGIVRLMASLLLSRLLRNFRRRFMYFLSAILTLISLVSFATCNLLVQKHYLQDTWYFVDLKWASLVTACLLVFSVQLGIQTLPYLLSGELFPSDIRAFCKGLTRSMACMLLVLGLKMYPVLEHWLSVSGTFYLFGCVLAFSLPIVYCILPETKDMGLEMIQNYFTPSKTVFYVDLDPEGEKVIDNLVSKNQDKIVPNNQEKLILRNLEDESHHNSIEC